MMTYDGRRLRLLGDAFVPLLSEVFLVWLSCIQLPPVLTAMERYLCDAIDDPLADYQSRPAGQKGNLGPPPP